MVVACVSSTKKRAELVSANSVTRVTRELFEIKFLPSTITKVRTSVDPKAMTSLLNLDGGGIVESALNSMRWIRDIDERPGPVQGGAFYCRRPVHDFPDHVSRRITNEISGVSHVAYDISGKPPATIERESRRRLPLTGTNSQQAGRSTGPNHLTTFLSGNVRHWQASVNS